MSVNLELDNLGPSKLCYVCEKSNEALLLPSSAFQTHQFRREYRTSKITLIIPGVLESAVRPFISPATGAKHRVRIRRHATYWLAYHYMVVSSEQS